jgi:hypothetical protein
MIRQATTKDIPQLAKLWYAEKPKTCFNKVQVAWSELGCASYLTTALTASNQVVLLAERERAVTAAIGIRIGPHRLPPHVTIATEWMWWGSNKRDIVRVLHTAKGVAKAAGAVGFQYTLNKPSQSGTKFTEVCHWEVL